MSSRKTAIVRARIEPELKHEADAILEKIGLSQSDFLNMAYRQLVMRKGIPFDATVVDRGAAFENGKDRRSEEDRERAREKALEAIRNTRTWAVKGGEDSVELIRRLRKERADYLAARHNPRPK